MNGCKLIFLLLPFILLLSCGDQSGDSSDRKETGQVSATSQGDKPRAEMTEEEKIMADMSNLMERLAEGDKSALYENEFNYYQFETPLSEYWKLDKVYRYKYDTLRGIEFDSVKIMGDSARVWARVIYESSAGKGKVEQDYNFWMYNFSGDRWIKPYISVAGSYREMEYLENLRRYEEEAGE